MAVPLTTAMQTQIANLYISILGRNPDPVGFGYWCDVYANANGTQAALDAIASGFGKSPEFTGIYSGQTVANAVALMYNNILGRTQDAAGATYWQGVASNYITSGKTIGDAYALTANAMITAAAANTGTADATLIASKQATAVTAGTSTPVTTYTLTTAAQEITGSNLVVNAYYNQTGGSTDSTLTALDSLVGSGTNNTLNLTTAGTPTSLNGAQISGFQTLNIRATANTGNIALNTANVTGLTNLNQTSTGTVQVSGLNSGAAVGLIGNGAVALGNTVAAYAAAATVSTLNVTGGVGPTGTTAPTVAIGGTGTTSAVINSTGAANTIGTLDLDGQTGGTITTAVTVNATTNLTTGAITGAAVTSYTLNGAGTINLSTTALAATVTTVNAAGNSGGVTVALGSSVTQTVTGGSGNDVITTGAVLTTGSVNAGSGTADVLDVGTNVAHVNTTALAAKYTNFEILRINGNMDMALFPAFTGVQISGNAGSAITNMTAAQAANVSLRAAAGGLTFALATATGTSDVLTINAGLGTTTAAAATIGTLVATGFETINLNANPGPTATSGANKTSTLTAITNTSTSTMAVNLTGTAWTLGDIASTKVANWTASSLTGNGATTPVGLTLTTTGAAFAGSVVTGSSLRDSVIMDSSTGVTFNLGAGNDIFSTTTALLTPSGAATDNTVNAGDGTSDQLIFSAAATATDTTFTKTTGFETLQLLGGATANSVTGLGAGFLSAFANGVTVTDSADQTGVNAYTWASGLYGQNVTLTHTTTYAGTAAGGNQTITTGSGTDTITVTATSWVGVAGNNGGTIAVTTGAGNDTITVSTGTQLAQTVTAPVVITGGLGADTIFSTGVNITTGAGILTTTYVIAAGDSLTTAYDSINGFDLGTAGLLPSTLDLAGTSNLVTIAATAAAGFSAAELTVAVAGTGLVTFAGTSAASLTLAQRIAAVQSVVTGANGDVALFTSGGNSYVFQNNTTDTLVELVGVAGTNIILANANTAGAILVL